MAELESAVLPDGARLAFRRWGRGPPVYLLHGGPGGSSTYWPLAMPWLGETHEVFAIDMRGHGVSSRTPPYTLARFGEDLCAFADTQGHAAPALLGHSLGALVVLEAATRSDRWSRIVVVGGFSATWRALAHPRGFFTKLALGASLLAWNIGRLLGRPQDARKFLHALLKKARPLFHGGSAGAAAVDEILWASVLDPLDAVAPLQRDLLTWSVDARLPQVHVPALVVEGKHDGIAPGAAVRLARRIPSAALIVIPHAGHSPFFDAPEAFRAAVEPFLGGHKPDKHAGRP